MWPLDRFAKRLAMTVRGVSRHPRAPVSPHTYPGLFAQRMRVFQPGRADTLRHQSACLPATLRCGIVGKVICVEPTMLGHQFLGGMGGQRRTQEEALDHIGTGG